MSHHDYDDEQRLSADDNPLFQDVLQRRLNRRRLLGAAGVLGGAALLPGLASAQEQTAHGLTFEELPHGLDEHLGLAPGYDHQVLIRWGDPVMADAPPFDPHHQSPDAQARQFGFNNDFVGFVPLEDGNPDRGLLTVNHEYTDPRLMFPGSPDWDSLGEEQVAIEIAAHGLSVIEIRRRDGQWAVVTDSPYNRRITPETPMAMSGPAAGSERLKTAISPDGVHTLGTYGNCAGGVTPWGTILTGEENVDFYFNGDIEGSGEEENYRRFGMAFTGRRSWGKHRERWDLASSPREPLHVGWIVEIDPFDPESVPRKRTALGRCKHEGCNVHINTDGRVAAYTGDDAVFEYIYRFVSRDSYNPDDREANLRLLDEGDLSVARFNDDGTLTWLPLRHGKGPLNADNGFHSQADVVLDVRKAADLVGATRMDRPEDVEVNPATGRVYAMLTNNRRREQDQTDAANPRAENRHGQIVEFWPEDGDHGAGVFRWELLSVAGNPAEDDGTLYHPKVSENGWFSCPDNCTFDQQGNIWIATDGAQGAGVADGIWAMATQGPERGLSKRFLRTPVGAELCGPFFTPDDETLFCAVQHPGERSSFEDPATRWPDFDPDMPPRPAVVAISRRGGGTVGG